MAMAVGHLPPGLGYAAGAQSYAAGAQRLRGGCARPRKAARRQPLQAAQGRAKLGGGQRGYAEGRALSHRSSSPRQPNAAGIQIPPMGNQSSVQEARANACEAVANAYEAQAERCEAASTGQFAIKTVDPPSGLVCKMGENWAHDLQMCVLPQDAGGESADTIRPDSWCAHAPRRLTTDPPVYICGQSPLFEHLIRPPHPGTMD